MRHRRRETVAAHRRGVGVDPGLDGGEVADLSPDRGRVAEGHRSIGNVAGHDGTLADDHVVAGLKPGTDAGSQVQYAAAADDRVRSEDEERGSGPRRLVADDGTRIGMYAFPRGYVRQPALLSPARPRGPRHRPGPP